MKKILAIIAVASLLALVSCGGFNSKKPTTVGATNPTAATAAPQTILDEINSKLDALNSQMAALKVQMVELQNQIKGLSK